MIIDTFSFKDLLSAVKTLVEKFSESKAENTELVIENESLAAENKNFKTKFNADAAKMLELEATIEEQKLQTEAKLINAKVMSFAQNKVLQNKLENQTSELRELQSAKVERDELRNGKALAEAQKKVLQDKLQEQAKELPLAKLECDELRNGKALAEAQNKVLQDKLQDLANELPLAKLECDELRNGKVLAEAQNKIMRTQLEEQHEKIQDLIKEMEKQHHSVSDASPLRFDYYSF